MLKNIELYTVMQYYRKLVVNVIFYSILWLLAFVLQCSKVRPEIKLQFSS